MHGRFFYFNKMSNYNVNGTQCLEYNWATLFLGDINKGTWPSRLGRVPDETVKYGYGFSATWTIE
jgi:hypothetical protein